MDGIEAYLMNRLGKSDEELKVHVPTDLKVKLMSLAERQDRKLSDYLRHVLSLHVYGNSEIFLSKSEGANRDEESGSGK
jgi:hypothetical protein